QRGLSAGGGDNTSRPREGAGHRASRAAQRHHGGTYLRALRRPALVPRLVGAHAATQESRSREYIPRPALNFALKFTPRVAGQPRGNGRESRFFVRIVHVPAPVPGVAAAQALGSSSRDDTCSLS